jgi:hypothetical protein
MCRSAGDACNVCNPGAEETEQPAEAAGRDIPAAKEEMLTTSGMSAGAVAAATDEERRAARRADHQARLADVRAHHHARLAARKQRLPLLAARLWKLWRDVGGASRPAPTRVHLRATAAVEKQLEKAEVLLQLTGDCLAPSEAYLMKAEVHLRSAKEHLEAAEAELEPAEAPQVSTDVAVVGVLNEREPVRRPPKGKAWSLQKRAWCLPGEARGQPERHRRPQERGVDGRPDLLLKGKAAPRESCGQHATTWFRREGPKGHGLEPSEAVLVPTSGGRRPARTPPASTGTAV